MVCLRLVTIYYFVLAIYDKLLLIEPLFTSGDIFWWSTNWFIFVKDFIWFFASQQSRVDSVNANEKLLAIVRMCEGWIKINLTVFCLRFFFGTVKAINIRKLFHLTIFSICNVRPNTFTCWLIKMKSIYTNSFRVCAFFWLNFRTVTVWISWKKNQKLIYLHHRW